MQNNQLPAFSAWFRPEQGKTEKEIGSCSILAVPEIKRLRNQRCPYSQKKLRYRGRADYCAVQHQSGS
jgi:hypothetical protein